MEYKAMFIGGPENGSQRCVKDRPPIVTFAVLPKEFYPIDRSSPVAEHIVQCRTVDYVLFGKSPLGILLYEYEHKW